MDNDYDYSPIHFPVNASCETARQRIADLPVPVLPFATPRGQVLLQPKRQEPYKDGWKIAIYGLFEWPNSTLLYPDMIEFTLVPLAAERTEVEAACHSWAVAPFFVGALRQIMEWWPESRKAIGEYLKGLGAKDDTETKKAFMLKDEEREQLEREAVQAYRALVKSGLSQVKAAGKVKWRGRDTSPIPRSTLNDWCKRYPPGDD